jgi:hypothetical protein
MHQSSDLQHREGVLIETCKRGPMAKYARGYYVGSRSDYPNNSLIEL